MQQGVDDGRRTLAPERQHSGAHLVQNHAKREQIRAGIQFPGERLLGRHVCRGSHGNSRPRQLRSTDSGCRIGRQRGRFSSRVTRGQLGQAKVEDFGVATPGEKDVRGLDVAVDDARCMGSVEGLGDLDGQVE